MGNKVAVDGSFDDSHLKPMSLPERKKLKELNLKSRYIQGEMSNGDMLKLQNRILKEYGFLKSVYESMLVVDNTKKDCPIVYANDDFEKMTLYSKEEIIGRNCRFLQGKYTNKETVTTIRKAVQEGKQIEVEILNYRKDGQPFWNNFLMLPIHKSKKVTHFIAIQKDVTLIKQGKSDPQSWTPPEVAMWLDHVSFGQHAQKFCDENIDGEALLKIDVDRMLSLGVFLTKDRNMLQESIRHLKEDPKNPYGINNDSSEEDNSISADVPHADYFSPKGENGINFEPNIQAPSQVQIWRSTPNDKKLAVKCYYKEEIKIFLVKRTITLKKLGDKVSEQYGMKMHFKWLDEEGDEIELNDQEDLNTAIKGAQEGSLHLNLTKSAVELSDDSVMFFKDMIQPVLLVTTDGKIVFCNKAAKSLLQYEKKQLIGQALESISSYSYPSVGTFKVEVLRKDSSKVECYTTCSKSKNGDMRIITFIPQADFEVSATPTQGEAQDLP